MARRVRNDAARPLFLQGIGFDANRSWLWNDHFYLGTGFGLERLIGTEENQLQFIPTFRLNVGVAF